MTSIWLRPKGRQEQRLQELINRLAEEHGTVKFAPHLTVCGVPGDLAVLDAAAFYVRRCGPEGAKYGLKLWNKIIKTYENVSQFWTWPEQEFLAHPVYSRDYPPLKKC